MSKKTLTVVPAEPISSIDVEEVPLGEAKSDKTTTSDKAIDESKVDNKDNSNKEATKIDLKVDANTEGTKGGTKEESAKSATSKPETTEEAPPKPQRPLDDAEQMKRDLKDAFPNVEDKVINTVLIASSGTLESAFNALLYYNDPSLKFEINPNPANVSRIVNPTITDDELLARRLQKEYEQEERRRHRERRARKSGEGRNRQHPQGQDYYESPDEFEQIKETFTQGFEEAKSTINGWVSGIAKKFDGAGEEQEKLAGEQRSNQPQGKLFGALGGSSFNEQARRKPARFDEDPQIIANDFHNKIRLDDNDNDNEPVPSLPNRRNEPQSDTPAVTKKWQPLTSDVPPNSDAFLVDDSEDEDEQKKVNKL